MKYLGEYYKNLHETYLTPLQYVNYYIGQHYNVINSSVVDNFKGRFKYLYNPYLLIYVISSTSN